MNSETAHAITEQASTADAITFWDFLRVLRERWRFISTVTLACTLAAAAWAWLSTPIYRAEVLLLPVAHDSDLAGVLDANLSFLSDLAGLNRAGSNKDEAIATLQSRTLTDPFIKEQNLLPILFADIWDAEAKTWNVDNDSEIPSAWDANDFFNKRVRTVSESKRTGLVTLAIDWSDPELAANWANDLAARTNSLLRSRALARTTHNIEYLETELRRTSVVELQQAISKLLEAQLKQSMMAKGNPEFAFTVIDAAVPPKKPARPRRALILVAGFGVGFGGASLTAWSMASGFLRRRSSE